MKKSLFFAVLLFVAACTRTREMDIPAGNLTLKAITEGSAHSRTVIDSDTHVFWEPGDAIAVFSGEKSGKFVSSLATSSASATFSGSLGTDAWPEEMDVWAVYPYSEGAVFDGETVTTVLPSEQVARVGSFGKEMNLAIAHSTTNTLQFYNVGGGIRFSLGEEGITEVVLEGMDGEVLAGKVKVGFQDGLPVVLDVTEGKNSIRLTPSEGESFEKDKWYFIVAIPGALEKGFKLHFEKAGQLGARVFDKTVTIKRSIYGKLSHADEGATYATVSDENIVFKDDQVKSIVVNYFDKGGDGELSYREAAVVLSFLVDKPGTRSDDGEGKVSIFAGTGIKSFDELVYFTGLTRIEDGAFAGCTELTSITIPENIVSIGDNAFNGCINLESITVMSETPPSIGTDAFANTGDCPILVPAGTVETYVSAWSEYAERIEPTKYPVPEAVDLGLPSGLKWASFNLGATKPEEYGDYYAWGETEPYYSSLNPLTWRPGKEIIGYYWPSYKWCNGTFDTLTKYCTISPLGADGFTDGKSVLEPEDDAAYVMFGGKWRMPTFAEQDELRNNCTWTWTTENGVNGYRVTSNMAGYTDRSIFLPAAGFRYDTNLYYAESYGLYWSSSLYVSFPDNANSLNFESSFVGWGDSYARGYGSSIRPVYGDQAVLVESVSLDKTELELSIGEKVILTAMVLPENATYKSLTWTSRDPSVATVDYIAGVVTGRSPGSAVIIVTTVDGQKTATCTVSVKEASSPVDIPEAIDLGLPSGLKWASFNLGASAPEEYGDYYAWGETEPKTDYSWDTYQWCMGSENSLTKYSSNVDYGYNGFVDGKIALDPDDDAAHVHLGDKWRMPTEKEMIELRDNCSWTRGTQNGVDGWLVTANNGKSIFFPFGGLWIGNGLSSEGSTGAYWTSELFSDYPSLVWFLNLSPNYASRSDLFRYYGFTIRPVYGDLAPAIPIESISLDKSEIELWVEESCFLSATILPDNATNKTVIWSSSNTSVATVSSHGIVRGVSSGSAVITATAFDGGKTAICNVTVTEAMATTLEAVDLGLSVKWASLNLGAAKANDSGDYYAWGEMEPYYAPGFARSGSPKWRPGKESGYCWESYRLCDGMENTLTKYNTYPQYGSDGFVDNKTVLELEDDVAHVMLGDKWRMPTKEELTELKEKCTWTWRTGEVNGYVISSPTNGNSIFIPTVGYWAFVYYNKNGNWNYPYGGIWSSSVNTESPSHAYHLSFGSDYQSLEDEYWSARYYGYNIRPVYGDAPALSGSSRP